MGLPQATERIGTLSGQWLRWIDSDNVVFQVLSRGYVTDCKSVNAGSIPAVASMIFLRKHPNSDASCAPKAPLAPRIQGQFWGQ